MVVFVIFLRSLYRKSGKTTRSRQEKQEYIQKREMLFVQYSPAGISEEEKTLQKHK